jgi:hypothetical protein
VASLETRTSPTGTSFRVKWRQHDTWQSETFGADRKTIAQRFRRDVGAAGIRCPRAGSRALATARRWTPPPSQISRCSPTPRSSSGTKPACSRTPASATHGRS